ncbi:reverse transcriptase domain-containing protein [Tanacetum coccineum]|uniref:Reverse transcriptase domain-containing protein n=1 Tax=Tanacetum coccineum TaxID=301880 RepID=A0ABQ5IQY3_9ASTR
MPNNVKTYDGTGDLEDHLKIFQAADQQKKYVKDPVEIHNIKQRDGETIEEFIERFKIETGRMKGALECMRISGFMHGVNNPELTKRLNEHVSKTMEEMMTATMAFIRGEIAAASKKKVHTPWKSQDQSKQHTSKRRSDFQNQPKDGRGSNKFTPLTRTPKEILAAESGKFKPPPPMLRKQIEELVRAGKLSHFIKEIRKERDQQMSGKKDTPAKDKAVAIYMIQPWQRVTRQKVTQSFARVKEITFPPLDARDAEHSTKAWMNFMIVRSLSPYNGIIGRPGIREIQAVASTAHGMLKFSVDGGIVTIRSTILIPDECATLTTPFKETLKEAEVRPENLKIALHSDFSDQEVAIRGTLSAIGRTKLCSLLKENLDVFAWQLSDMTGVPRSMPEHRLNIQEGYSPVRQKKRGQALERAKAIQAELEDMRGLHEFKKACPQDCYPLLEIDWKVESLCGYPFKCFLDAYKGYHQIQIAKSDEEKTAFHTSQGVYCYTKMPFGLKNAGATYQRLVDKAFSSQVGRNIELYVDDLVIKSYTETEMLRDID